MVDKLDMDMAGHCGARNGLFRCPFPGHEDSTPSLKIYDDDDNPHYHCFGCGAHGPLSDLPDDLVAEAPAAPKADDAETLAYALKIWARAKPIAGTPAARYLTEVRGIEFRALPSGIDEVLRFHSSCPFNTGRRVPCLIALFRDVETDEPAGIHRIALPAVVFTGAKVERRMLGSWPNPRAIKLWPASTKLYLGEGIETVLAAATRLRDGGEPMMPAWAAASSGNMTKFPVLAGVEDLILLVDHGEGGEDAGATCCQTWQDAGRRAQRLRTQDPNLNDFNDLVRAKLKDSVDPSKIDWSAGFEKIADDDLRPRPKSRGASHDTDPWPTMSPEAYHGLAGEVVAALQPHTEADPVALLAQYLVYFGNCVGRGPHMVMDGAQHFTNLFTVIAGATAKSRKGTSAERVRNIFDVVDQDWTREHITGGLSSGEGVIWAVRDPVFEYNKKTQQNDLADPGVVDKRLLLDEREFSQALAVQRRDGSTLSAVLRDAWDGREVLKTLTKHSRGEATRALISIVGQITIDELREMLDPMSMRNGFVNRFLFVCTRRGPLLPRGGGAADINLVIQKTTKAIAAARNIDAMQWTERSGPMWDEAYVTKLSVDRPGLFGAITARAEPQAVRLAMLYALLDESPRIHCRHLKAALALWDYCDDSARFLFGDMTGDSIADTILYRLREAGEAGLSRTAIRDLFGRHVEGMKIELALQRLLSFGKAKRGEKQAASPSGGKPIERWFAT